MIELYDIVRAQNGAFGKVVAMFNNRSLISVEFPYISAPVIILASDLEVICNEEEAADIARHFPQT